jgi:hypothetical protein
MGVRDNMLTVGCQSRDRSHLVLARTWQVLPRVIWRTNCTLSRWTEGNDADCRTRLPARSDPDPK